MVAFFAAVSAPAFASNDEKPKKEAKKEAKATVKKAEGKAGCATPCSAEKAAPCEKEKK